MNVTLASYDRWLLHCAVGGGLLLLLTWCLMRGCRQPARRQRLGECGLLAALVLGALSLGPAWLVMPVFEPIAPAPAVELQSAPSLPGTDDSNPAEVALASPQTAIGFNWAAADSGAFPPNLEEGAPSQNLPETAPAPASTGDRPRSLPSLATAPWDLSALARWTSLIYAALVAFFGARWLLGHLALYRLIRNTRPAPEQIGGLFADMAKRLRRQPRLLVSERLRLPVSCGLCRPTVMIPAQLCEPDCLPAVRWVFAHELTHLERRDAVACLLFGLGQVIYFYVPWFWWLRRQVRLCQEYIADAAAAAEAADPEDYAQFLLNLRAMPAAPLGATGVMGNSSDLFWRVTMLLQVSERVDRRCPRWWSLAAIGGFLALAVLFSGISLRVQAAAPPADTKSSSVQDPGTPQQPEKKAETPKKTDDKKPSNPQDPFNPERIRQVQEQIQQQMQQRLQDMQQLAGAQPFPNGQPGGPGGNPLFRMALRGDGRLGVQVQRPGEALADQLDLPRDEGLLVIAVQAGTPAAKAGLKTHDVLLEIGGKAVSSDVSNFVRFIDDLKSGKAYDAVVLRKGKKETVKGITLAEKPANQGFGQFQGQGGVFGGNFLPGGQGVFGGGPMPGGGGGFGAGGFGRGIGGGIGINPGGQGVITTNFRVDDRFTTRHQEGSLIITVTGTVAEGKSKVSQIQIQDGRESLKYEGLEKVPEQYRDKVKNLIEVNGKSNARIEINKTPKEPKPEGE